MKKLRAAIIVTLLSSLAAPTSAQTTPTTDLSKKTQTLVGKHRRAPATKAEVLKVLGRPDFAVLPGDKSEYAEGMAPGTVSWFWLNGRCAPVEIQIRGGKVVGSDSGFLCDKGMVDYLSKYWKKGGQTFSCKKKARKKHCR